ncbi:MAG: hypothetical protein AAF196_19770 [Planctomycetota bacterium]
MRISDHLRNLASDRDELLQEIRGDSQKLNLKYFRLACFERAISALEGYSVEGESLEIIDSRGKTVPAPGLPEKFSRFLE